MSGRSPVQFSWFASRSVLGQDTEFQTAPDVLVLHGSHHQCVNVCMNHCESLWTKCSECNSAAAAASFWIHSKLITCSDGGYSTFTTMFSYLYLTPRLQAQSCSAGVLPDVSISEPELRTAPLKLEFLLFSITSI